MGRLIFPGGRGPFAYSYENLYILIHYTVFVAVFLGCTSTGLGGFWIYGGSMSRNSRRLNR